MKYLKIFIFLSCCVYCAACSFTKHTQTHKKELEIPKEQLSLFTEAVEKLGANVVIALDRLEMKQDITFDTTKPSYYIYNSKANNQKKERRLAKRFIEDLNDYLVKKGIFIKRKEMATWARATGTSLTFECKEFLQTISSDYLIDFSLRECSQEENCVEAKIDIIANKGNNVLFSERVPFNLRGNVSKWYNEFINIDYAKGKRESPFSDSNEAAKFMVGEISCMVNSSISSIDNLIVVVKKTDSTPESIRDAFSSMLTYYGIQQVPDTGKLFNVMLKARDKFEMEIFQKDKKEKLGRANVVMAIHSEKVDRGKYLIRLQLITLKPIEININNARKKIKAGILIPKWFSSGYVLSNIQGKKIRATGTGFCNKTWDKEQWEYSAYSSAKLAAKRNLITQVRDTIISKNISNGRTITHEQIKSMAHAVIKNAVEVNRYFDKVDCSAKVTYEVEEDNIIPLNQISANNNYFPIQSTNQKNIVHTEIQSKSSRNFYQVKKNSSAYKQSQAYMIGNVELYLRDQLKQKKISPKVIRLFSLEGEIDLPDCRKEDHYLASQNVPARHYCTLGYNLGIIIQNKNLFKTKGSIKGIGSNRNTAWDDALLGISQEIFPFFYQIALKLSEKVPLNSFKQTLTDLDKSSWTFANDLDSLLDELEKITKQISNF